MILTLALMIVFGAVVRAQGQDGPAVPLPPTPAFVSTRTAPPQGKTMTPAQLQQLFEIRDRRKYDEAMRNEGRITEDEYTQRLTNSWAAENEIITAAGVDQIEAIWIDDDIKKHLKKLWPDWLGGWPVQTIRRVLGFALQQPAGTRATSHTELSGRAVRINLTPLTDEVYDNVKRQLEAAARKTAQRHPDPDNNYDHRVAVGAAESANGKPWVVYMYRRSTDDGYIQIEILGGE